MSKDPRFRFPGLSRPSFPLALALACVAALAAAAPASAAWAPAGYPFCNADSAQSSLRAVTDGRGGFIAAWIDGRSTPPGIYCQRVDSTGAAQWTANGTLVCAGRPGVRELAIAADGANGVVLAWTAGLVTGSKVYVQHLNGSGGAQWAANGIPADTTAADSAQSAPAVAADASGGAIVAWVDGRGANADVYAQRVLSAGTYGWSVGGVLLAVDNDDQAAPRLLGDGAGGAWVSWEDLGTNTRVYFQWLDGTGAATWTAGGVTSNSNVSTQAVMARVPGGNVLVVAWLDTGQNRIEGTLLQADGSFAAPGGSTYLNATATPARIVARSDGSSWLAFWTATQVQAQLVSGAGIASGSPVTLAGSQTLDATSNVTAVSDGADGLYAVWSSGGVASARHLTSGGTADWAAPVPLTSAVTPPQTHPVAVGGFDLLTAWVDGRNSGTTGADLYAQRVAPNGMTGSYYRILASVAGGSGNFTQGGGRTWVRAGDSLRVLFTGANPQRVDHVVVGATNLGPVPNYTFHAIAGDSTLQAYFSTTPATLQVPVPANAYRAFSVPFTLASPAVSSAFANLMPYDPVRWRLGHWVASDSAYAQPGAGLTSISPGAGYWFIGLKDTTLSFSGAPVVEAQYNLAMLGGPVSNRGWTQFGSPFRFPVAVSQLRLSLGPDVPITDAGNTYTDHQVLEWNPGSSSYVAVGMLLPGHSYWLWRQSSAPVSLGFPFEWNPVATGGLAPSLVAGADWSLGITAKSGEREAQLVFGAAPVPAGRWNGLSTHAAPAPGEGLSLVARVPDWGADDGDYRSVFRPDAESLVWDFDAGAPAGLTEAALSFAFTNLPADRRVVLSEPATGWSREVVAGASVPLVLSAVPRRLHLEVVAGAGTLPTAPLATALRAAGPNPFRDAATLSFSLARGGLLRWEVFDLAGRRVVSDSRTLAAGEHAVTWDGRDAAGRRVQPGLYLLRWQADGRSGSARLVHTD